MSTFQMYFQLGVGHILNFRALDHILFILALSALYTLRDWRKVLILVTAFTLGHSVTLALSAFDVFRANAAWVEFLIPVTILITAASNVFRRQPDFSSPASKIHLNYFYAFTFGLIHGLGLARELVAMVGRRASVVEPLLAYNLGIELGQVVIVLFFLLVAGLIVVVAGVSKREWTLGVSATIVGMAFMLMLQNKIW
ncbi:HupE/UreJ family protein [Cesiribacter sp. SM1]|uniref:HupE/UreJ family protein n=1 Tax=Cesiribacter sp. SM1 TaxID=2861196 RepID=UPI001CD5413F|nr:HupE/UreJ family protein [Cesiribacter sp. SM1]